MNIQLFIVIIIGLAVGIIIARMIYRFFFTERDHSGCGGCSGCNIKGTNHLSR